MRVRFGSESVLTPQVSAQALAPIPHRERPKRRTAAFNKVDSSGYAGFFRHNLQVCREVPRRLRPALRLSPVPPI